MARRTLMLLVATAIALLLAGCNSSQGEDQGSRQGSEHEGGSWQQHGSNDRPQVASVGGGVSNTAKIAFSRLPDGAAPPYNDIYVADEDCTDLMRLAPDPSPDDNPVWLPNGEKIAFKRLIGGGPEYAIYTMNADG